jgi:hypothetical protein
MHMNEGEVPGAAPTLTESTTGIKSAGRTKRVTTAKLRRQSLGHVARERVGRKCHRKANV